MKDATRNAISNHIGDASALVQHARESLQKASKLRRGRRHRDRLENIDRNLDMQMDAMSRELDELEPDGCPF